MLKFILLFLISLPAFGAGPAVISGDKNVPSGISDSTTPGLQYGLKQYVGGIDYTFSSTPAGWTFIRSVATPYETSNGAWRIAFNISATITASSSTSVVMDGVTFKNVSGYNQACVQMTGGGTFASRAWAAPGSGTIGMGQATATTSFTVSCDVELDSKPTWAD